MVGRSGLVIAARTLSVHTDYNVLQTGKSSEIHRDFSPTAAEMLVAGAARAVGIAAALVLNGAQPVVASAGEVIFETKCAACHEGGGNVLQRGKTLFPAALASNGYATEEAIASLLVNGKGQMPKYQGAIPSVSKLTDEEIREVAAFVLQKADAEWK